jgi:hypothetical protein
MTRLWTRFATWIQTLRFNLRARRESRRIATQIQPKLWEDVRRKLPGTSRQELANYAQVRAAQLIQPRVDALLTRHRALPGLFGTLLLTRTTERAVEGIMRSVARAQSRTPRTNGVRLS